MKLKIKNWNYRQYWKLEKKVKIRHYYLYKIAKLNSLWLDKDWKKKCKYGQIIKNEKKRKENCEKN